MKHIKTFESFQNDEQIKQDVQACMVKLFGKKTLPEMSDSDIIELRDEYEKKYARDFVQDIKHYNRNERNPIVVEELQRMIDLLSK